MKNVELKRGSEIMKVAGNKVELYKSCGWVVVDELFTYQNKKEQDEAWMERFGD